MELKNLLYAVEDGIATITLNRPKALNALNADLVTELGQVIQVAANDKEVKAVIVTGSDKAFAAGADISLMLKANPTQALQFCEHFHFVFDQLEALPKPVIAAVAGLALGGGCELAMACDLRIAAAGTMFGQPEINLGIIPGAGGTQRLPRLIGTARAKELIYTGDMLGAEEALSYGLINRIVAPEALLDEAKKLAVKLTKRPGLALAAAKRAINQGQNCDLKTGNLLERECFAGLFATEDQKEGMQAFAEKRKAVFKSC